VLSVLLPGMDSPLWQGAVEVTKFVLVGPRTEGPCALLLDLRRSQLGGSRQESWPPARQEHGHAWRVARLWPRNPRAGTASLFASINRLFIRRVVSKHAGLDLRQALRRLGPALQSSRPKPSRMFHKVRVSDCPSNTPRIDGILPVAHSERART